MGLDIKTIKDIQDFVYAQPRTIQEIAQLVGKNWRTADSYVNEIIKEYGTLSMKTFRAGTRGALKVVYWANIEKIHNSTAQEVLFDQIKKGRIKDDFEAFDVFYYCDKDKRDFNVKPIPVKTDEGLIRFMKNSKNRVLNFGGNLSWINLDYKGKKMSSLLPELIAKGVTMKVLARVNIASMKSMAEIERINNSAGYEAIEVRHMHHPLRAFVFDGEIARIKEEKPATKYKKGELIKDMMIVYTIKDPQWVSWLEKVFWHLFSKAMPAKERVKQLEMINEKALSVLSEN